MVLFTGMAPIRVFVYTFWHLVRPDRDRRTVWENGEGEQRWRIYRGLQSVVCWSTIRDKRRTIVDCVAQQVARSKWNVCVADNMRVQRVGEHGCSVRFACNSRERLPGPQVQVAAGEHVPSVSGSHSAAQW